MAHAGKGSIIILGVIQLAAVVGKYFIGVVVDVFSFDKAILKFLVVCFGDSELVL